MNTITAPHTISRRNFLIKSGWMLAGVTVLTSCSSIIPALPSTSEPELEDSFSWIQVLPGGKIRFYCPRMEMGQGAFVGLTQVVAEELNVAPEDIEYVLPGTDDLPPFKMTVGSESIFEFFKPVSYGAARMRETLRAMAANKTGLPADQIKDGRAGFLLPDGTSLSYGALVPSEPVVLLENETFPKSQKPDQYALKRIGRFSAIGQRWGNPELEAIVTGKTTYSRDAVVPDMVYGQVLRPPAFGATLKHANGGLAENMATVVAVVIDEKASFVGVVTDSPFMLDAAAAAITTEWDMPENADQDDINALLDVEAIRTADNFEHTLAEDGDLSSGRTAATHTLSARYDTSFAAHAALEPRASVVWVQKDRVDVWCGCQDPFFVQKRVAKAIGRSGDDVTVHTHRMGGGFGGRVPCQASEEAALLSAATGRPVRVQWSRETEFQNNYFQPAFSHFIDAGVTDDGFLSHWDHDFVSSPIITGLVPGNIAWVLDKVMADEGTARGGLPHYRTAHRRVRYADIRTPVPIGAWRGLGAAPNTFAIESMMDELAVEAGMDPLEFRLKNLPADGDKLAGVLRRVAETSKWGTPVAKDTGRGIACAVYKGQTPVAVVAEVRIDHAVKSIRVTKVWCAQDCGLVINPSQVENQVMGNIVWGCSMALKERLSVTAGTVEERNFDGYEILRHEETPEMDITLMDATDSPPLGVGESAFGPVAPAIANAVFAATGRRARRLPLTYAHLYPDATN